MSSGIVPNAVIPIPDKVICNFCPHEFKRFMTAWANDDEECCIEELAKSAHYFNLVNGDEVKLLKHEVDGLVDEAHVKRLSQLVLAFRKHTNLSLFLSYHNSESEGCAGDSDACRGVFWALDFEEVFQFSPNAVLLVALCPLRFPTTDGGLTRYRPEVHMFGQYCG